MIDHLIGRPSPSWKRAQVFLVIFFWVWRIVGGNPGPPRILWLTRLNRALRRFTPWQIVLSTLTGVYAIKNLDKILGLNAPEPLARLYSPSYYRATWIATGLDAGFATAMSIRRKWLRDLASIIFSVYYIVYAHEADEKLRRFRAVPTVEMLRTTWEKTTNPYIRFLTHLPRIGLKRKILLPRPKSSSYDRPITAYLFFAGPKEDLCKATELIFDIPGGGYVAMTPEHHEERLRIWAVSTKRPVLSLDYGKSPEYPYPFAVDEAFDAYRLIVESCGELIGMSGKKLSVIMCGDSAGGTLAVGVVVKILELRLAPTPHHSTILPLPTAMVLNYAALDFNFTSWMTVDNLRVLRSEQSSGNLPGLKELAEQKDHLKHISPLSMVRDKKPGSKRIKRRLSWKDTFRGLASGGDSDVETGSSQHKGSTKTSTLKRTPTIADEGALADAECDDINKRKAEDRPIQARIIYKYQDGVPRSHSALVKQQHELSIAVEEANTKANKAVTRRKSPEPGNGDTTEAIGTRLTMTSRTGYFQDRIISPSMMRAMAILYIGPHRNPDFTTDYHISPILAPSHLLAQFPPLLMQCGEKDPFVDDTVIFAGRVREAKRARKVELDLALSGKSARFGESLRMSCVDEHSNSKNSAEMKRERDKLANEVESDWVQMVLFSEWSHGYLQMPTLMTEARAVIEELAEWIDHTFERYHPKGIPDEHCRNGNGNRRPVVQTLLPKLEHRVSSPLTSETETDDTGITFIPRKQVPCVGSCDSSSDATMVSDGSVKTTVVAQSGVVRTHTPEKGSTATISEIQAQPRRFELMAMSTCAKNSSFHSSHMELVYPAAVVPMPQGIPTEGPVSHPDGPPPRDNPYEQPCTQPSSSIPPPMPPQLQSPKLDAFFSTPELFNQAPQQPDPSSSTPTAEPSVAQGGAGANHYPSSSGVPRLPPILQVEKQQVTTSATQLASASRRRNEAHFVCPVPGCGSTFTRRFNLRGHLRSHTEERPYVCEWPGCKKGFARQHDCKRHQALHAAKSQSNVCQGCKKTFSRLDALNRHLRSDGGADCRASNPKFAAMEDSQSNGQGINRE